MSMVHSQIDPLANSLVIIVILSGLRQIDAIITTVLYTYITSG
jgi:hypothetical protein